MELLVETGSNTALTDILICISVFGRSFAVNLIQSRQSLAHKPHFRPPRKCLNLRNTNLRIVRLSLPITHPTRRKMSGTARSGLFLTARRGLLTSDGVIGRDSWARSAIRSEEHTSE